MGSRQVPGELPDRQGKIFVCSTQCSQQSIQSENFEIKKRYHPIGQYRFHIVKKSAYFKPLTNFVNFDLLFAALFL